jgi:hypothetical protein
MPAFQGAVKVGHWARQAPAWLKKWRAKRASTRLLRRPGLRSEQLNVHWKRLLKNTLSSILIMNFQNTRILSCISKKTIQSLSSGCYPIHPIHP